MAFFTGNRMLYRPYDGFTAADVHIFMESDAAMAQHRLTPACWPAGMYSESPVLRASIETPDTPRPASPLVLAMAQVFGQEATVAPARVGEKRPAAQDQDVRDAKRASHVDPRLLMQD